MFLPNGLAVDPNGTVYIADLGNQRIRRIGSDGGISTLAKTVADPIGGLFGFGPAQVAVDFGKNLYATNTDPLARALLKIDTTSGAVTTIADKFGFPYGVAVEQDGSVLVTDRRVFRISADGSRTAITGSEISAAGVALDRTGILYVADNVNHVVYRIRPNNQTEIIAGNRKNEFSGDGELAVNAGLSGPVAVAVDNQGNLFIAEPKTHDRTFLSRLKLPRTCRSLLQAPPSLVHPVDLVDARIELQVTGGDCALSRVPTKPPMRLARRKRILRPHWTHRG